MEKNETKISPTNKALLKEEYKLMQKAEEKYQKPQLRAICPGCKESKIAENSGGLCFECHTVKCKEE
jgi:hypothetical protein